MIGRLQGVVLSTARVSGERSRFPGASARGSAPPAESGEHAEDDAHRACEHDQQVGEGIRMEIKPEGEHDGKPVLMENEKRNGKRRRGG